MNSFVKLTTTKKITRRAQASACLLGILSLLLSLNASADDFWTLNWFAKDEPIVVTVNDAYINVHNAPGRGYPIFHVVERGELITLLKMHTDWIKIRTARGIEGWIKRSDVLLTLGPYGAAPDFPDSKRSDYLADRFELGAAF